MFVLLLIVVATLVIYKVLNRYASQLQDAIYYDNDDKRTAQWFALITAQGLALFFGLIGVGLLAGEVFRVLGA
jgi:hypothetical protein